MFGQAPSDEFVNNPTRAGYAGSDRGAWGLLVLIFLGIAAFIYWAAEFEIEEVTRGLGRVVPAQKTQIVQSLEPGIVRSIDMAEGDIVEAGQTLMQIDDTEADAQRGELLEREAALLAEEIRLNAEVSGTRLPDFPSDLKSRAGNAVLAELDVLSGRFDQYDNEITVLDRKRQQRNAALAELRAERSRLQEVIAPLEEEAALTEDLASRGAVSRIELLRLRSQLADLRGALNVNLAEEPRLLAEIAQVDSEVEVARSAFVLTAQQRLARLQVELAIVQEALRAAQDRVTRRTLKAPIRGTVNSVSVTTLGEVVEAGKPLVEIVPIDDSLLIRVDIPPKDVAFIRPGEKASVKITAYDYLVYGALEGEVTRIGADTIQKEDGAEYFEVTIRTDATSLIDGDTTLAITPGMTASVDIQTGQRSVLSYLLSPLLRVREEALRER